MNPSKLFNRRNFFRKVLPLSTASVAGAAVSVLNSSPTAYADTFPRVVPFDNVVIFTGSAGDPNTEYYAPPGDGNQYATYVINVSSYTKGQIVTAAWYAPLDNIGDLSGFAFIAVRSYEPHADRVILQIASYDNSNHRIRLRIYLMFGNFS